MPLSPRMSPDDAERNPWTAPTGGVHAPRRGSARPHLRPLYARRTTFRLIALGFLVLGVAGVCYWRFVSGRETAGKFLGHRASFRREGRPWTEGPPLELAVALTALARLSFAVLGNPPPGAPGRSPLAHGPLGPRSRRSAWPSSSAWACCSRLPALVGDREGGLGWVMVIGSGVIGGGRQLRLGSCCSCLSRSKVPGRAGGRRRAEHDPLPPRAKAVGPHDHGFSFLSPGLSLLVPGTSIGRGHGRILSALSHAGWHDPVPSLAVPGPIWRRWQTHKAARTRFIHAAPRFRLRTADDRGDRR